MSTSKRICPKCGKPKKPDYAVCYACHENELRVVSWLKYAAKTPDEREADLEAYYNTECSMCGKEGADYRSDGKPYCSTCWQTWNS